MSDPRPRDGGSYARQPDGSLVRLSPTTQPPGPAPAPPTPPADGPSGPPLPIRRRRGRKE